jgi:hypothetical protein
VEGSQLPVPVWYLKTPDESAASSALIIPSSNSEGVRGRGVGGGGVGGVGGVGGGLG